MQTLQDTPYADLDDYLPNISDDFNPRAPDLTLKCKKCTAYLQLDELVDHGQFHDALEYFGCNELIELNANKLNAKRSELLKLLLNKHFAQKSALGRSFVLNKFNEWPVKFSQLNTNYELLKAYIGNRFETRQPMSRHLKLNSKGEYAFRAKGQCQLKILPNRALKSLVTPRQSKMFLV